MGTAGADNNGDQGLKGLKSSRVQENITKGVKGNGRHILTSPVLKNGFALF
jgi:hypothetical protein